MARRGSRETNTDTTLRDFLTETWLPAIRRSIRDSTYSGYVSHVHCHIIPALGSLRLASVKPSDINGFYARLLREGGARSKEPLSGTTVRRVHATFRRAFRDAVKWGLVDGNPVSRADPPSPRADTPREMTTWRAEELKQFLSSVAPHEDRELWHVLAMTGLRRGEALGLRWCDVDFERASLSIRQTVITIGYDVVVSGPKSSRGRRVVALDETTLKVLRDLKPTDARAADLVFHREGQPLHPVRVSKTFKRLVRQIGLPDIRLHDLRHTHATLALEAGIHPKIVSERLGHSTVALTLDIYSHCLQHMQHDAAEQISRLVAGRER
ncbi:MAG: site-specific integrase [Actinomycetota bacterium]|nr:site-specific integrase [Actinomycetota bacterium]